MTTRAAINLPTRVFNSFHKAKDVLNERAHTFKETTQQAKESLVETTGRAANTVALETDKVVDTAKDSLTATTHKAVDAVTAATNNSVKTLTAQAKDSLEQTLQTTEQLKGQPEGAPAAALSQLRNTTSDAIQTAINSSVNDWLVRHPVVLRLVQVLLWATNHPILSLVILLITIALAWSLIKAVGRLFEIAGLSLLKAPLMLGMALIGASSRTLHKFGGLAIKQLPGAKNAELPVSQYSSYEKDKQQRLAEISIRLEAISQEQNELLQEAAAILAAEEKSNGSMDITSRSL